MLVAVRLNGGNAGKQSDPTAANVGMLVAARPNGSQCWRAARLNDGSVHQQSKPTASCTSPWEGKSVTIYSSSHKSCDRESRRADNQFGGVFAKKE